MALLEIRTIGEARLALWRLDESVGALLEGLSLSPAEQAYDGRIAHPRRRREWLAARRLLRAVLGPEVSTDYDPAGRPVLVGGGGHLSFSHTDELVALYHAPEPCGVDIERCDRPFERAAPRFASADERALPGASLPLIWCLKEAAYKYAHIPGLDFLRDLRVEALDPSGARVALGGGRTVALGCEFFAGHCLAWTLPVRESGG